MDNPTVAFRVENDALSKAVAWATRALATKATNPALKGMRITAADDVLEFACYDYEVSNVVRIDAQVDESGVVVVAGKMFAEITQALPKREVSVQFDGSILLIECGSVRYELPSIPEEDFPAVPALPTDTGTINPALFNEAVSQVSVAASKDQTLPMLTGISVKIRGEKMVMASTDRYRLAVRRLTWNSPSESTAASMVVPAAVLAKHASAMESLGSDDITIALGGDGDLLEPKLLGIHSEGYKATSRLLDSKFPNYEPLLPTSHKALATIDVAELLGALKRISIVTDKSGQVHMDFSSGQVVITAGGSDSGRGEEIIKCAYVGEPLSPAFNTSYIRDGLLQLKSERVLFGFTTAAKPAVLMAQPDELPEADEDGNFPAIDTEFTYLLMPVRVAG